MLMGGSGNISVTANVAPAQIAELCAFALGGKAEQVRQLNERLVVLHTALFCESNPIPVKWALQYMGMIAAGIRLPLCPLAEEFHPEVVAALAVAGPN